MTDESREAQPGLRPCDVRTSALCIVPALTFAGQLVLMLQYTYIPSLLNHLHQLRWWPFFLLAGVSFVLVAIDRRLPRHLLSVDWFAIALIALAAVSSIYSLDPVLTIGRTGSVALMYVAIFCSVWAGADRVGPALIVKTLVAAGIILFVVNAAVLPLIDFESATLGRRYRGMLQNANTVGLTVAFLAPLVVWAGIQSGRRVYWGVIALMLVTLLVSQSRTAFGGALVGTGYFLHHAFPARRRALLVAAVLFVALSALWSQLTFALPENAFSGARFQLEPVVYAASSSPGESATIVQRMRNWDMNPRNQDLISLGGRIPVWLAGLSYLGERPLLGYGFGVEDLIMSAHGFSWISYGDRFHNSFLGLALQVGIPAAIAFFCPLLILCWKEWRAPIGFADAPLRFALRGVLFTGLVVTGFESWIYSVGNAFAFLFWICVMLLIRDAANRK